MVTDKPLRSQMSARRHFSSVIEVIGHHKTDSITAEASAVEKINVPLQQSSPLAEQLSLQGRPPN